MNAKITQLSQNARQAIARRDGRVLQQSFTEILRLDKTHPEGHFLQGIFFKVQGKNREAMACFEQSLKADKKRYDAAVELANILSLVGQSARAVTLLERAKNEMAGSPYYLNFAAEIYTRLSLHDAAWPLFVAANNIQSDAAPIENNLAASAAKVGEMETAKKYYRKLLEEFPDHQRHHFELSRLGTAADEGHIHAMEALLEKKSSEGPENIFLYFALGKEYEDLGKWDEAFKFYSLGNRFAAQEAKRAGYKVQDDIDVIKAVKASCSSEWLASAETQPLIDSSPIFIVGLPRTGTTLVERILSAHSQVESVGESFFLDAAIKASAGQGQSREVTADIIEVAAKRPSTKVLSDYMQAIAYRRTGKAYFIEKLPLNFLNIGFVLKAMPKAKIISLDRKPMDACFAMFKQPYFRFSYDMDWLADYYMAFNALRQHWTDIAGDRVMSVSYENLVHDPDNQIKSLLEQTGLEFEEECLDFHLSKSASATASFAQIRSRAHTGSVNKWSHFQENLQPLAVKLEAAGIDVSLYGPSI